jgi:glutathionyl-hydroquinone reductase
MHLHLVESRETNHIYSSGWRFATADENIPGDNTTPDPLHPSFTHLREIYFESEPDYSGRFTVPVLYDTKTKRIVSNEVHIHSTTPRLTIPQTRLTISTEL